MNYRVWLTFYLLIASPSAVYTSNSPSRITFNVLENLNPGVSTKQEVTKLLGKPTRVTQLKNAPTLKGAVELWEYVEKGSTRLTISFASETNKADTWSWQVYETDSQKDLKTALKQFPKATWLGETEKWINPHAFPSECFYRDKKLGVSVRYNEYRKAVESISRQNPKREPAVSAEDEKPPKFCIGESCSEGIPAKEWAKKGPTCPLPK